MGRVSPISSLVLGRFSLWVRVKRWSRWNLRHAALVLVVLGVRVVRVVHDGEGSALNASLCMRVCVPCPL